MTSRPVTFGGLRLEDDPGAPYEPLTAEDYFDDDDQPWADPSIQRAYEAALGHFVVTFNLLEDRMNLVLDYAYQVIQRPVPKVWNYASKIDLLDALGAMGVLQLDGAPIGELRQIGRMRNFLVHGHFDQNPFDGSYVVRPIQRGKKPDHVRPEAIDAMSVRAMAAFDKLRHSEAIFFFRHVSLPP